MQDDYDFYLSNGISFRLTKHLVKDFEEKCGSAAAVEIARLVCDNRGLKQHFDEVYTLVARFFKSKEKHWVLIEFQNYINRLHERNNRDNDGNRFGFQNIAGLARQAEIQELERDMQQFLSERNYYESV